MVTKLLGSASGAVALAVIMGGTTLMAPKGARADLIVYCQNIQGGVAGAGTLLGCQDKQGNSLTDENIFFNTGLITTSTDLTTNNFVQGSTKNPDVIFNFASTTDLLA